MKKERKKEAALYLSFFSRLSILLIHNSNNIQPPFSRYCVKTSRVLNNEQDKVPSSIFRLGSSSQEGLNLHWVKENDLGHTSVPSVSCYSSYATLNKLMNTFTFTCFILISLLDIKIPTNIFKKYQLPILYQNPFNND